MYKHFQKSDKDTFIENLIYLREVRFRITQEQMAQKLGYGLKYKTYQSWENKRAFPPVLFVRVISQLFQIPIETMLTRKLLLEEEKNLTEQLEFVNKRIFQFEKEKRRKK